MSEHNFHPIYEGCIECAALPNEDVDCIPPETGVKNETKG
jgi:hypothetical protein